MKDIKETLAGIVTAHEARQKRVNEILPPEKLRDLVDVRTVEQLNAMLQNGASTDAAMESALEEGKRHARHLMQTAVKHADEDAKFVELDCAQCGEKKPHVLERDLNNEWVATCTCGRFQKFPSDHEF